MKVGVLFPSRLEDPGEFLADARAMEAAGVDSVWLSDDAGGIEPMLALAAIAAVTNGLRLGLLQTGGVLANAEQQRRELSLQQLSRKRLVPRSERWKQVDAPVDGEAWSRTLATADDDSDGVIVPLVRGLLDMLRNPEEAIDRPDLILAQG